MSEPLILVQDLHRHYVVGGETVRALDGVESVEQAVGRFAQLLRRHGPPPRVHPERPPPGGRVAVDDADAAQEREQRDAFLDRAGQQRPQPQATLGIGLQAQHGENTLPREVAAFGISGHMAAGLQRLFMSHPPLAERIAALRNG